MTQPEHFSHPRSSPRPPRGKAALLQPNPVLAVGEIGLGRLWTVRGGVDNSGVLDGNRLTQAGFEGGRKPTTQDVVPTTQETTQETTQDVTLDVRLTRLGVRATAQDVRLMGRDGR